MSVSNFVKDSVKINLNLKSALKKRRQTVGSSPYIGMKHQNSGAGVDDQSQ